MKINQLLAFTGLFFVFSAPLCAQVITTVAGTDSLGYNGDGIPASTPELNHPCGVTVDSIGNLYIADFDNSRIRRVDASSGIITTLAGIGIYGYSGDAGLATEAAIWTASSQSSTLN